MWTALIDGPFALGLAFLWLPLVGLAIRFRMVWDRLPQKMAVHFDAAWNPNGWTDRSGAFQMAMITLGSATVVVTIALLGVRIQKPRAAWPVLILSGVIVIAMFWVNNWILTTNLAMVGV